MFEAIASGEGDPNTPASFLDLGTTVLPPLPMDGGDRNRTSPFAFTGNKFEFRALGSSMSLAFPNTVLNTIAAEAIDELAGKLEEKISGGMGMPEAVIEIVKDAYAPTNRSASAATTTPRSGTPRPSSAGLKNLRTTPDALPEVLADDTVAAFEKYNVLSKRELESRYEVWVEQYAIRANIEAEETFSIAQTMLLPAALRQLALIAEAGVSTLEGEVRELVDELVAALGELKTANAYPDDLEGLDLATYARDNQLAAMAERARGGGQAGEGRRRRPLAASQVRGDALHQVGGRRGSTRHPQPALGREGRHLAAPSSCGPAAGRGAVLEQHRRHQDFTSIWPKRLPMQTRFRRAAKGHVGAARQGHALPREALRPE